MAARNFACDSLSSESACKASSSCVWFSSSNKCVLAYAATTTNARGKLYCSGSPLDTAVTCATLASTSCAGDCAPGDSGSVGGFLTTTSTDDLALEESVTYLAQSLGAAYTGDVGTDSCKAKWLTNTTLAKSLSTANSINSTTTDGGLLRLVGPLFVSHFIGNCSAATKVSAAAKACAAATTRTACAAATTCYWAADPTSNNTESAGKCDLSVHAYITMGTIDKTNDPWGVAYAAAYTSCSALTTESACTGAGTVQLNTTLATSWLTLTPSDTIAPSPVQSPGGGGGGSSTATAVSLQVLMLSVLMSLFALHF
ncbi:hypothetical protein HXX76_006841 [Chlamydomonas incerta]|uniref:Uncharacterized protein n=1 Tax=Chlamydomonas incerta TaxID=51695 RepID=A0A835SYR7_CHLIN|nr:hypothetical protein HXX76_006841 [Chlamydomonas incerta]|eukprot:KAG2435638.1 hypothetical protein HXX76_006841 [Chlamydomonas incerta]